MKTYDQRTPKVGDVVMLKSDEFYGKEERHYFVVTEVHDGQVVCLCGNALNPIRVDKSVLFQMELGDRPLHEMKQRAHCYEDFL